jgi:hypothetical protein
VLLAVGVIVLGVVVATAATGAGAAAGADACTSATADSRLAAAFSRVRRACLLLLMVL